MDIKNYLLAFVSNSLIGEKLSKLMDGDVTLISNSNVYSTNLNLAKNMKKAHPQIEEIYFIESNLYTQQACEMSNEDFYDYISHKGYRLV